MSSFKLETRHFHVAVVEGWPRDVQKSVQNYCFANRNLLFLTFSSPSPSSLLKLSSETEGEGGGMKGRGLLATVQATFI